MNSPFTTLFLSIQQQISANIQGISCIDQDLGQLRANVHIPVSWPCVLIDFEDFTFGNLSENVQTATGTVVIRLGFAPYSNSSQITPKFYKQQAVNYYEIEWLLHKTLQGWSPAPDLGYLDRISATTQKRTDNYRVREIRYTIAFEDYSTKLQQQLTPATLNITEEMNIQPLQ